MISKKYVLQIVAVVIIFVMLAAIVFVNQKGRYSPIYNSSLPNRQVIVDPGHGGEDGGATDNNIVEKDINLDISLILADLLKESGFEVILTRDSDISIYDESEKSLRNKKRSDIMNRLKIANENPSAVFVSVHQNKFGESKYSGAQVFYGEKNEWSKPLAQSIQTSIVSLIQPQNTRLIKPITKSVYLINNAKPPAVLCECGFLSNSEEASLLSNPDYQRKMAFSILNGIINFYSDEDRSETAN